MKADGHIIRRASLLVNKQKRSGALDLQHQLSSLFWEELVPEMEAIFDELVHPDELIRLERLELDLGALKGEQLERELKERLLQALRKELQRLLESPSSNAKRQPLPAGQFEAWLFYLENGYFPWSAPLNPGDDALKQAVLGQVAGNKLAAGQIIQRIKQAPIVLQRLVWQYDDGFLQQLLTALSGYAYERLPAVQEFFKNVLPPLASKRATSGLMHISVRSEIDRGHSRSLFWSGILQQIARSESRLTEEELIITFLSSLSAKPIQLLRAVVSNEKDTSAGQYSWEALQWLKQSLLDDDDKWNEPPLSTEDSLVQKSDEGKSKAELDLEKDTLNDRQGADDGVQLEESSIAGSEQPGRTKSEEEPPVEEGEGKKLKRQQFRQAQSSRSEEPEVNQRKEAKEAAPSGQATPQESQEGTSHKPKKTKERTFIYIKGAGLVLLHPFLPTFFRELKLVKEQEFLNEAARARAVQLLDMLTFGQNPAIEHEMVLAKLLCKMPLEIPVYPEPAFTDTEMEEAEHLLRTVIKHWGALGNASPDGLREGFLQREGRLERKANGWHLTVKRKTEDILVDRLPWGRSMIQLPWMGEMLRVEW